MAKKAQSKKVSAKKKLAPKKSSTKKAVAIRGDKGEIKQITEQTIIEYMDAFGIASQLNDNEKHQFVEVAKAYQLNPFKREIYAIPYETSVKLPDGQWGKERKLSVITGYEVYLKRAARLAVVDGWDSHTEGSVPNMKAVCTIYRKDWKFPFKHEVEYSEYVQKRKDGKPTKFWAEKPKTMLKKVAIAQSFRMCFPDEFGGMPYTSDELPNNMTGTYEPPINNGNTPEHIPPSDVSATTGEAMPPPAENQSNAREYPKGCPLCSATTLYKDTKTNKGYFCWKAKGGCGTNFDHDMNPVASEKKTVNGTTNGTTQTTTTSSVANGDKAAEFWKTLPTDVQHYLNQMQKADAKELCTEHGWSTDEVTRVVKANLERLNKATAPIENLFPEGE